MRVSRIAAICLLVALALAGCSGASAPSSSSRPSPGGEPSVVIPPNAPSATTTVGQVELRVAIVRQHDVVLARRAADGTWERGSTVLSLPDRECGSVGATAAGELLALTLSCDVSYAADTAPTRSVALVTTGLQEWHHHDLSGEAYRSPVASPDGTHVVWVQGDGLLRWSANAGFVSLTGPHVDAVSVSDEGSVRTAVVVGDGGGLALSVAEDSATPVTVVLPAHQFGGDAEYDGVFFRDPDTLRVRTPPGIPDLTVVRRSGSWVLD